MSRDEKIKMIAMFMGYIDNGDPEGFMIHPNTNHDEHIGDILYDTSWDWLMPVVEKIESLVFPGDVFYNFNILGGCQVTVISSNIDVLGDYSEPTKLLTVFKAVVEFIEWYNKNNYDQRI